MTAPQAEELTGALQLARWTINSGSNIVSRGAVQIVSGEHRWEATAEGNGPIDALYAAVDRALADVLSGHPRLLGFELRALAEGPDAVGLARVRIAPPVGAAGARGDGRIRGRRPLDEHGRGLDRGLHRRAEPAARRGALGRRDRGGRQPA